MVAAKTFSEWYAFFGGEEMAVSRDEAEVIWNAAIKSLNGVQTQTTNRQIMTLCQGCGKPSAGLCNDCLEYAHLLDS